jgi:outer membrane protein OmpA-like peptidoglycan-associated protein
VLSTFWKAIAAVAVAMVAMVGSTLAQSGAGSNPPDPAKLIEALREKGVTRGVKPSTPPPVSPQTAPQAPKSGSQSSDRSKLIADLRSKATRGLSVGEREQLAEVLAERPAVDLEVYFDLDSAVIGPKAEPTLKALGTALRDAELRGKTILLAGHTDASGSRQYNQGLSERRARAVRDYLVKQFGLNESMLMAVGYGPERLKLPKSPFAGENRRVEVVNLGE